MIYGRSLFWTMIFLKQLYSDKIRITFEPLVRFEKFKVLNWSELNFLLIYAIFKFDSLFTRHFAAKMSIVATKSEKKSFFVIWTGAGPQCSVGFAQYSYVTFETQRLMTCCLNTSTPFCLVTQSRATNMCKLSSKPRAAPKLILNRNCL